jgi:hypothetical protein
MLYPSKYSDRRSLIARSGGLATGVVATALLLVTSCISTAGASTAISLGTAAQFAVLAGTAVTNVPTSSITGGVGLSPAAGTSYTGLTGAEVQGTIYSVNAAGPSGYVTNPALLTSAKNSLTAAFTTAAGLTPTSSFGAGDNQLGGKTLTAGVYAFGHAASANLTAAQPLTLNGHGNPNAKFVFQASSNLVTSSDSVVKLINGAQACNVYWVVQSSATLGSASSFVGTIMALTSATLASTASVQGRVLARNGDVTLDSNTITVPSKCTVIPTGFPHTGFGGASQSMNVSLILIGSAALATAGIVGATGVRRFRRITSPTFK